MATGRSTQLTRQIGEHLVAAELGRRGLIATPFAGNVPNFDLLVANEAGVAIPIQVKAISGPSWQFNATSFLDIEIVDGAQRVVGKKEVRHPGLICVLVLLRSAGTDEFFILNPLASLITSNRLQGKERQATRLRPDPARRGGYASTALSTKSCATHDEVHRHTATRLAVRPSSSTD